MRWARRGVEGRVVRRGVDRGESKQLGRGESTEAGGKGQSVFFSARALGAGGWVWAWLPAWLRVRGWGLAFCCWRAMESTERLMEGH